MEPDSPDSVSKGASKTRAKRGAPKGPYRYPGHLRNSAPRNGHCHVCRCSTLTATYDALPIRLDPQPLSLLGEIDAVLHKKQTWFIANGNLYKRNVWAIKTSPTGFGGSIHQGHLCGAPQPSGLATNFPTPRSDDPGF